MGKVIRILFNLHYGGLTIHSVELALHAKNRNTICL